MSDSGSGPRVLTKELQDKVKTAIPAARAIARSLSTACPNLGSEEVCAIAEAELAAEALRWDANRGPSLVGYARKGIVGAILNAAEKEESAALRAARKAGRVHAEGLQHERDLAREIAETDQENRQRSYELGEDYASAMYYAYTGKRPPTVEDAFAARERESQVRAAHAALDPEDAAFLDLLYEQDLGWEAVAARLGISVSTAQRWERKLLKRLRAALLAKGVRGAPTPEK